MFATSKGNLLDSRTANSGHPTTQQTKKITPIDTPPFLTTTVNKGNKSQGNAPQVNSNEQADNRVNSLVSIRRLAS